MQLTKSLTSLSVATLGGAVFSLISADIAQAVTFTFDGDELIQWSAIEVTPVEEPTSVPEPSSMLGLLALGGLGAKSAFKKLKK